MDKFINMNDKVKVKLTDRGRYIYSKYSPSPKKTDINGYSEFQLWDLFHIFGRHTHIGFDVCFMPDILIEKGEAE